MKKLTVIGTAVIALAASLAVVQGAAAKPTGTSPDYQALVLRSDGMNQLYGLGQYKQLTLERGTNERFAPGNPLRPKPVAPRYGVGSLAVGTLERGTDERFAIDNPVRNQLVGSAPSTSTETSFQWSDAGIGAGALLGLMALIGTGVVAFRHRGHNLRTS